MIKLFQMIGYSILAATIMLVILLTYPLIQLILCYIYWDN